MDGFFDEIFGRVGLGQKNNRLDFVGGPDHNPDPGSWIQRIFQDLEFRGVSQLWRTRVGSWGRAASQTETLSMIHDPPASARESCGSVISAPNGIWGKAPAAKRFSCKFGETPIGGSALGVS